MKISEDILNELKQLSPVLASMERVNVFSVPDGYFENLSDTIVLKAADVFPLSSSQISLDVPEGYFDGLANAILDKVRAEQDAAGISAKEELKSLSPLLSGIQHKNVFKVPNGYFEGITDNILHTTLPIRAKVVSMHRRLSFFKYTVAAAVAGLVIVSIYMFTDKPTTTTTTAIAPIPVAILEPFIEKGKNMNELQFNETLNNLSAEDIASYLENNTEEADIAMLTSDIDAGSLPAQEDYLLDEKALENYLAEIDLQKSNN